MSHPVMRSSGPVRALAILLVAAAVIARLFFPRLFDRGAAPPAPAPGAPAATAVPAMPRAAAPIDYSIGFRSPEQLREHFEKHGSEFEASSPEDYLRMAQLLRDRPAGGDVLEMVRDDGVTCRFDRSGGAFLAFNRDRTIRTFFRPNDGEAYFRRQAGRPAAGR